LTDLFVQVRSWIPASAILPGAPQDPTQAERAGTGQERANVLLQRPLQLCRIALTDLFVPVRCGIPTSASLPEAPQGPSHRKFPKIKSLPCLCQPLQLSKICISRSTQRPRFGTPSKSQVRGCPTAAWPNHKFWPVRWGHSLSPPSLAHPPLRLAGRRR
jgi:hypothetical protein